MLKIDLVVRIVMAVMLTAFALYGQSVRRSTAMDSRDYARKSQKISITILAPEASGLGENQSHLPTLVQDEFIQAFSGFFDVRDMASVDAALKELVSGAYADTLEAIRNIGHLTNTSHYMVGTLTKAGTAYHLSMGITKIADNMMAASYSNTFTYWELNNRTGIRQAALELLQKMGVTLTAEAKKKLIGSAKESYISSRNAYAQGVTAQRQGSEVAALSYYLQAAAFDPSMQEAVNRSSILSANMKTGKIGQDVRNDIASWKQDQAWRKQWVERLAETERYFDKFNQTESMPYTLFYKVDIEQKAINYQRETVDLRTIAVYLRGSAIWAQSIEKTLQAVYDGLNATGRANDWGLANWPYKTVTDLRPFAKRNDFFVGYKLLNVHNKVIGHGKIAVYGSWQMSSNGRPSINVTTSTNIKCSGGGFVGESYPSYIMEDINANDITDNMTIQITSVNGEDAETAAMNGVLHVRAMSQKNFSKIIKYRCGELNGFNSYDAVEKYCAKIKADAKIDEEDERDRKKDEDWEKNSKILRIIATTVGVIAVIIIFAVNPLGK